MHPVNLKEDGDRVVHIVYDNDGVMIHLSIIPHSLTFGRSVFDESPQWLLTATDVDLNLIKIFRMRLIRNWSI